MAVVLQQNLTDIVANSADRLYEAGIINSQGTYVLSPLSIVYATALVLIGSRGQTRENIRAAFRATNNETPVGVVEELSRVLNLLNTVVDPGSSGYQTGNTNDNSGILLSISNALFFRNGLNVDQDYANLASESLQALVRPNVGLPDDVSGARNTINDWVRGRTNGNIQNIIPEGALQSTTDAILVNAARFNGVWDNVFDPALTSRGDFNLPNGQKSTIDYMDSTQTVPFFYDADLKLKYAQIPFKDNEVTMLIFLPDGTLEDLEAQFEGPTFGRLSAAARPTLIRIKLPKFKLESTFNMTALLARLGVVDAFTSDADLTGFIPAGNVSIDQAFHKAIISIDENGAEVNAASAMKVSPTKYKRATSDETPVELICDHPFAFGIRHNPTRLVLFVGRVTLL